jgi:hypothetical protein
VQTGLIVNLTGSVKKPVRVIVIVSVSRPSQD